MTRPNPFRAVAAAASICGVDGLRAQGVHIDPETFDVALDVVWRLGDERLSVTSVDSPRNSSDDEAMTPKDVAQSTGLTEHAVRKAARAGLLNGNQDNTGRWTFEPEAVAEWRNS